MDAVLPIIVGLQVVTITFLITITERVARIEQQLSDGKEVPHRG